MESITEYPESELLHDYSYFVHPMDPTAASEPTESITATSERVSELEEEVARLRGLLGKAKGINDAMWETIVQGALEKAREKSGQMETNGDAAREEDGRTKKRGRT